MKRRRQRNEMARDQKKDWGGIKGRKRNKQVQLIDSELPLRERKKKGNMERCRACKSRHPSRRWPLHLLLSYNLFFYIYFVNPINPNAIRSHYFPFIICNDLLSCCSFNPLLSPPHNGHGSHQTLLRTDSCVCFVSIFLFVRSLPSFLFFNTFETKG